MLQTMLQAGIARTARFPVPSHIHRSAWNKNSANFAFWAFWKFAYTEFSEVRNAKQQQVGTL